MMSFLTPKFVKERPVHRLFWKHTAWSVSKKGLLKNEEGESLSALFQLLTTVHFDKVLNSLEIRLFFRYILQLQPRLTSDDLTPGNDYTKDELLSLFKQKTSPLDNLLSQANSK